MQTTNTTSYPAPDQVKNNWEFTEVWIDPMLSPPYILYRNKLSNDIV
ncbi:MAG: hypothetical protein ACK5WC_05805 [Aphanizomenon sp.]|jgi:hypothetical protein